jgi:uncharacterized protein with HEPN domain
MLAAIDRIARYVNELPLDEFIQNEQAVDAVIRNFIVIGEAASHVPVEVAQRYPDIPWATIRGMRNAAVHDYVNISLQTIWNTSKDDLPLLRSQLQALLDAEQL